ncbi:MAG: glycerol-3-phosphate 1-O-acyltransferase PlsY [Defluviitaleaceae bacterium]|nr:glycerol-3-phosphate 1-O-acyltransferase PlsY [Defluviitaleaceae bacterium]
MRILALLVGYGFGIIQAAYIIGKIRGIDVKNSGSGNLGTTNALRTMGSSAGLLVFIIDVAKAVAAFWLSYNLFGGIVFAMYAGFGVILGHCFPFYLKFKGGKGIASYVGILFCIHILMASTILAVGVAFLIITKYMSLTSLIIVTISPIFLYLYLFTTEAIIVNIATTIICFIMHKGNISRLLHGTERRLSFGGEKE